MEISGNSLNQPVNFYTKNTGNTINMAITDTGRALEGNISAPEFILKEKSINTAKHKRKNKNKRLNTLDSDYIPDEILNDEIEENKDNIFSNQPQSKIKKKLKKGIDYFFSSTPLINYFFLKQKQKSIENTVEALSNINQNVDDLINTAVPLGEESSVYTNIADNLKKAARLIGETNKNI